MSARWRCVGRAGALALAALSLATGCGGQQLSFVQDRRVEMLRPADRSTVSVPLLVEWKASDFAAGEGAGAFGIFLDRAPQPPGKTLAWLFRDDGACRGPGGLVVCNTDDFLAQRNVYRTVQTSLKLDVVPELPETDAARTFHEVTVVLLDRGGRRVGEGAWSRQFRVRGER